MRFPSLRLSIALATVLLMVLTVPCGGEDYIVIHKKDGQVQKLPLGVPPDEINSIKFESSQTKSPTAEPPSGPISAPPRREPAPSGPIMDSEANVLVKEPPRQLDAQPMAPPGGPTAAEKPETPQNAPLITRDAQPSPEKPQATQPPQAAGPALGGVGELMVNLYQLPGTVKGLPDYSAFRPQRILTTDMINLNPSQGGRSPAGIPSDADTIGMRAIGLFKVKGEGIFQWRVHAKDGVRLNIDDKTLIENDGLNKAMSKTGYVHLGEGIHVFMLDTFNSGGKPLTQVFVTPPNGPEELFSATRGLTGWSEPAKPYDVLWGQVYFVPKGKYPKGPQFNKISPIGRLIAPDLSVSGGDMFPGVPGRKDMIGVHYEGYFNIVGSGIFAFRLAADDYAKLTVGEHEVAEVTSRTKDKSEGDVGWVFLQEGSYPISIDYFHPKGDPLLQLYVTPPVGQEELFRPSQPVKGYMTKEGDANMIPGFVYLLKRGTKGLPNFNDMEPSGMFFTNAIDYPVDRGTTEFPGVPKRDKWLGLRFYVKFSLSEKEKGVYKFRLVADDGAKLIVGKKLVINADGYGGVRQKTGTVTLNAGTHEMFVDYYQATGPSGIQLYITPPGEEEKIFAFQ